MCFCLCYVNTNVYLFLVFEIGRSVAVVSSKILLCAVVHRYIVCSQMSRDAVQKVVFRNECILTYPVCVRIQSVTEVMIFHYSL